MKLTTRTIKPVMLVSGLITCTMFFAVISPDTVLQSMFGQSLGEPLAQMLVRNWAILITLVGAMLIYGAFHPQMRTPILIVASISKVAFIGLVFSYGFTDAGAGTAIWLDVLFVVLFASYLAILKSE